MKNKFLLAVAIALSAASFSQTAHTDFNVNFHELAVQGLTDESILVPELYPVKVSRMELQPGKFIEYATKGSPYGQPVIFLHGLADSWRSFEKVLPLLPDDVYAVALTQRGHGNANKNFNGYTPKHFAADVAAVMRKLNIPSAVVVGHSMGGVAAQQFAVSYPKMVNGLVIIGSDAAWGNNPGVPEFLQMAMRLKEPMDKAFMESFQVGTVAKGVDSTFYQSMVAEGMKVPVRIFQAAIKGMVNINFLPSLPGVKVPVLLLWGDKDNVIQLSDQEAMLKALPDARLITYEGHGHSLHWENPQRFAADVSEFVHRISRQP